MARRTKRQQANQENTRANPDATPVLNEENQTTKRLLDLLTSLDNERKSIEGNQQSLRISIRLFWVGLLIIIAMNILLVKYLNFGITGGGLLLLAGLGSITNFSQLVKKSKAAVQFYKQQISALLPQDRSNDTVAIFAVKEITRDGIELGATYIILNKDIVQSVDESGCFEFGPYEELGTALLKQDNSLDFQSPILMHQHWIRAKRRLYVSDESVLNQLSTLAPV